MVAFMQQARILATRACEHRISALGNPIGSESGDDKGADTFIFDQSKTFWGVEAGLDILTRGSARFGAKTFYQSSSDTHTTGGSLFVKLPLWDPPAVAPDTGIRIARGK
jgi:hypothetical protein